ncbi:NEQ122 [Nanoarchaeum equitans Kin4-M]|uniref:NEQ122 n=1 Tax=Nanoarchaeum equitans (strain Kin4-M) TaxID=228908 RepID=Q74N91_NANEQ|nr:NEQ122 [Nanoarchaeum equitans Kin4-M]
MRIIFLGSGGGRNVFATQIRGTGGFIIDNGKTYIHVDPGEGALVRAKMYNIDIRKVRYILVSHVHLDHANDVNAVIDAITLGGIKKRGILLASESVLKETPEFGYPIVRRNYLNYLDHYEVLREYEDENLKVKSIRTKHTDPYTLGMKIEVNDKTIGYTADTRYFPELAKFFENVDVLIANTLYPFGFTSNKHLSLDDAIRLAKLAKPKMLILTHFGKRIIKEGPAKMAEIIEKRTNVRTIAARDGLIVNLEF